MTEICSTSKGLFLPCHPPILTSVLFVMKSRVPRSSVQEQNKLEPARVASLEVVVACQAAATGCRPLLGAERR